MGCLARLLTVGPEDDFLRHQMGKQEPSLSGTEEGTGLALPSWLLGDEPKSRGLPSVQVAEWSDHTLTKAVPGTLQPVSPRGRLSLLSSAVPSSPAFTCQPVLLARMIQDQRAPSSPLKNIFYYFPDFFLLFRWKTMNQNSVCSLIPFCYLGCVYSRGFFIFDLLQHCNALYFTIIL